MSVEINLNCKQFSSISGATPIGSVVAPPIVQDNWTIKTHTITTTAVAKQFDSRDASAAYVPRMLHSKCKDKTRRSVELARARTRCDHPVISVPAGMKKILTDALGTQFITISSVRPQRHESKLFSSFQVRVRGLDLEVGWLGFCPRAFNWSRSVECARPAMSSSLETVSKTAKHAHIQQLIHYSTQNKVPCNR